jgi:hypothetical protein
MAASVARGRPEARGAFILASVPIVMLVIHTYQNLPERNTLDDRSGNYAIYGTEERANVLTSGEDEAKMKVFVTKAEGQN